MFRQRLSATPRGARLARRLAVGQLNAWRIPYGSDVSEAVALIVAELAANAVTHGRVPGRDFELRLGLLTGSVRVEVTDSRSGPRPPGPMDVRAPLPLAESGRGLVIVDAVADRWEVLDREPPGKTVRAEVDVPGWCAGDALKRHQRQEFFDAMESGELDFSEIIQNTGLRGL